MAQTIYEIFENASWEISTVYGQINDCIASFAYEKNPNKQERKPLK